MKKILSLIIALLLMFGAVGCQDAGHKEETQNNNSTPTNQTEQNNSTPTKQNGQTDKIYPLSCGNDNGYYLIEQSKNGYSNLAYIDYQTQQKIILCAKPNCSHNNNTCNSYLENDTGIMNCYSVYCADNCLYLFYSGVSSFFTGSTPPAIYRLDLNGENRNVVYTASSGVQFDNFATPYTDGNSIYFQTKKMERSKPNEDGVIELGNYVNYLTCLNLASNESTDIIKMQNRSLLASYKDGFIMSETDEIPQNITDAAEIEKYIENLNTRILLYHPNSQKETLLYTTGANVELWNSIRYNDLLFFVNKSSIEALNLENKTIGSMIEGVDGSLALKKCYDGRLYFEIRNNDNVATAYQLDLTTKKYSVIDLRTNEPGSEPISVLAEAGNNYLVIYRCDRTRNPKDSVMIDENGVEHTYPDYIVNKQYYALIAKTDYQNCNAEYREIVEG